MTYHVFVKHSAERELDVLDHQLFRRIKTKLLTLEENPRPVGSQKLHGQQAHRLRVGDYRILYVIDDKAKRVDIVSVAHRREAYR